MEVVRGSSILIGSFFVSSVFNYLFYLVVARLLSPSEYGVMGVLLAVYTLSSFIVVSGTPQTVLKRISMGKDIETTIRDGFATNILLGLFISLIIYSLLSINLAPYKNTILILSILILLTSVIAILQYALLGLLKFKRYASITILNPILKLLFSTLFVILGLSVFGVFLGFLTTAILLFILTLYFVRVKFWCARGKVNLEFFNQSALMLFGTLSIMLLMNIDIIAVKFLSTNDALAGYYQSAIVLARFPVWITWALMMSLFPYISKNSSHELISSSLKYVLAFLVPISIALSSSPQSYIKLLFPAKYLPASQALGILSGGMAFLSLAIVLGRGFQAIGKERIVAISLSLSVIFQIILLTILVPKYGITGGALATAFASLLAFVLLAIHAGKIYSTKNLVKQIISYLILYAVLYSLPMESKLETIVVTVIASTCYLTAIFILRLITAEDVKSIVSGIISVENPFIKRMIALISNLNNLSTR